MRFTKLAILIFISAFAFAVMACSSPSASETGEATQAAREVEKEDGSTVAITNAADGTKTEVRTFKTGDVASVTRTTRPGGERTATVEFRDGRKAELKDESDIDKAMDATGDALAEAADKTWDTTKDVAKEAGDKVEDVAGKAVDAGKSVGKEVGDKAEDAAGEVKKGAKKVGSSAKKVGEKIKDKVTP